MPTPLLRHVVAFTTLVVFATTPLTAQDTRTVTEPVVPASCHVLTAALVPVADTTLADADERKLDTDRIQLAIDGCASGKSVVLRADGAKRAFLSGPLALKLGVTLVVDSNTILFGSRDPRVYDVTPNACGLLAQAGRGCYALIRAEQAHHSGIMGKGTIDGRGWASLLNGSVSWWELAQQARNGPLTQNCPRLVQTLRTDDFTLYQLTPRNPGQFHVVFDRGDGFTAWGVTINAPNPIARNTDASIRRMPGTLRSRTASSAQATTTSRSRVGRHARRPT